MPKITYLLLFILIHFFSYSNAQNMTSVNLLHNLEPFWQLIETIRMDLEEKTGAEYSSELMQSYSFIQLELKDGQNQLFLQIKYQIKHPHQLSQYSLYCDDEKLLKSIETHSNSMLGDFEWEAAPTSRFILSKEQLEYLEIADRIAILGNDIHGSPSHYGSILVTSKSIRLEQINHWNSRSLDHKDSYYLRDLYFIIPLKQETRKNKKSSFDNTYIGNMEVHFGDGSAKKSQATGDKIKAQLEVEIKNYK